MTTANNICSKETALQSILDNVPSAIYVCDTETYDLLYMNATCERIARRPFLPETPEKCYSFLMGFSEPCPFCSMANLSTEKFREREFTCPLNNHNFVMRGKLLEWNGKLAHIEYISDETERISVREHLRELQAQNQQRYEHELHLRKELIKDSILYYQLNLTTGMVVEYETDYPNTPGLEPPFELTYSIFERLTSSISDPTMRANFQNTFSAEALLRRFNDGESSTALVYRRIVRGKGLRWLKGTAAIVHKPDTDEVMALIYIRDIDDRKKNQYAIDSALDKEIEWVALLDAESGMAQLVQLRDRSNGLKLYQPFNFTQQSSELMQLGVPEEDQPTFLTFFNSERLIAQLENHPFATCTYRYRTPEGILMRRAARAFYLDETRHDIVITHRDITDLYKEEQEQKHILEHAVAEANRANQAKGEFLSRMSHDIRTPMNAIMGLTSLAQRENNSPATMEYLHSIEMSGKFLMGLINDILDLSKIESGQLHLNPQPAPLDEFIRGINTIIRPLMEAKNITFTMDMTCGLTCVSTDILRFNQIFFNLLSNAAKFTPKGGHVAFTAEAIPGRDDKHGVRFRVIDDGVGMSTPFLEHVFEPFTQERSAAASVDEGTGLGLPIVKSLVDAMGGTVSVQSELGHGTEFIVDLYLEEAVPEAPTTPRDNTPLDTLVGKRVLLVDDNALNTKIAKKLLEAEGLQVDCAADGRAAVEAFAASGVDAYDVVLMDIRMPIMSGVEATRCIRALERPDATTVPIIAMTADALNEERDQAMSAGMTAYLIKPVDPTVLRQTIANLTT